MRLPGRPRPLRTRRKRGAELDYWRGRAETEGRLANFWYVRAFTDVFGLPVSHYDGKRILDVGCGPRGSLEWAQRAARRVGLDPLAGEYASLGTGAHAMEYVAARAEEMPFPEASFDVVAALNALDHVEDVEAVVGEILRVLAPGGEVLLILETGRPPTVTEPHALGPEIAGSFGPRLAPVLVRRFEQTSPAVYLDLLEVRREWDDADPEPRPGWLVARLAEE